MPVRKIFLTLHRVRRLCALAGILRDSSRSVRNFQFLHYDEIYQGCPETGREPVRFGRFAQKYETRAREEGRERYSVYDGDDEEEMSLSLSKKESVFDYFDDGEESVG